MYTHLSNLQRITTVNDKIQRLRVGGEHNLELLKDLFELLSLDHNDASRLLNAKIVESALRIRDTAFICKLIVDVELRVLGGLDDTS